MTDPGPLQLPGLPIEEQMVDNWGQPTPFMQLRWQEMTEKIVGQEASQNLLLSDLASAQTALAAQGETLATTVAGLGAAQATLATTVDGLGTVTSNLSTVTSNLSTVTGNLAAAQGDITDVVAYLLALAAYQNALNNYITAITTNFLYVVTLLAEGTQPLDPEIDTADFPHPTLPEYPLPPTPPWS